MERMIMPPSRACGICRNRMNEVCIEKCAPAGEYCEFDPNMNTPLNMLPDLSIDEYRELNGKMKGEWLFIQLKKIVEAHNGDEIRSYLNRARSRRTFEGIRDQGLLHGSQARTSTPKDRS